MTQTTSPIAWLGGKSKLAKTIIARLPEHTCYAEVFAGGASVFFQKEPSKSEILNDINGDLVNFYRVLQNHLDEFVRQIEFALTSREEFNRWLQTPSNVLTDIQRAAKFYYLNKTAFGSAVKNPTWAAGVAGGKPRLNPETMRARLEAGHKRLAKAYIENLPYADFIERYDRQTTLFYLDSPYDGMTNYYGNGIFFQSDFEKMRDIFKQIKGKFIFSINKTDNILKIFDGFNIEEVQTRYSIAKNQNQAVSELLITNF